jgi:hypothetical protein
MSYSLIRGTGNVFGDWLLLVLQKAACPLAENSVSCASGCDLNGLA